MGESFLVLGCGSIGLRHIRNLKTLGIDQVYAHDPAPAARSAAEGAGATLVESVEAGLAQSPTAVLVCAPPHLHLDVASAAVKAGAHVFIEKPVSHTLENLDSLLDGAEDAGVTVMIGYNLRFHAGLRKLQELAQDGMAGTILSLRAEYGQYLPTWRPATDYRNGYIVRHETGGGIILEESHEFDYIEWIGGEIKSVFARAGQLSDLEMEAEDTALIVLELEGGRLAEIHVDCVQRGYSRSCKLIGSEATLYWDYSKGVTVIRDGVEDEFHPIVPDPNDMYRDEIAHFVECVRGHAQPPVHGRAARRVLEVVLAAKLSAQERREVIL